MPDHGANDGLIPYSHNASQGFYQEVVLLLSISARALAALQGRKRNAADTSQCLKGIYTFWISENWIFDKMLDVWSNFDFLTKCECLIKVWIIDQIVIVD